MRYYYAYDLYPSNDPKDGARIRRLGSLQSAGANSATSGTFYQAAAKGTGSGQIMVRGTTADAGDIDPDGLQYIRVRRVDTGVSDGATLSGYDEKVVGGFFLDSGDFDAITEANTKQLTFGGAGALSVLDREFMWSHTYVGAAGELSTKSGGQDPFDRIWRLFNQGDFAGGDHLGAVLWRVMAEGLSYQDGAYTHKHGDGTVHTDTHADDKTESAIAMVTLTFDGFTDSSGNDWTLPSGNFTADVGESLLSVVRRLMEAGLYIEMDPDTFELSAWEAANHGRDMTGASWGADVVRLQVSSDGDRDTGNIKSDARRAIAARIKRSAVLAGGSDDTYGLATASGTPIPWHGFYSSDAEDTDALEQIAATQVKAHNDAGDTVRARFKLGHDLANGKYLPFEDVLCDDTASLHSGSSKWDWNEATAPVAALTISLRPAGDWDAFADLGSSYMASGERNFQTRISGRAQGPTLRLCDPARAGDGDTIAFFDYQGQSGNNSGDTEITGITFPGSTDLALYVGVAHNSESEISAFNWRPDPAVTDADEALELVDSILTGAGGGTAGGGNVSVFRLIDPTTPAAGGGKLMLGSYYPRIVGVYAISGYSSQVDTAKGDPTDSFTLDAVKGGLLLQWVAGNVSGDPDAGETKTYALQQEFGTANSLHITGGSSTKSATGSSETMGWETADRGVAVSLAGGTPASNTLAGTATCAARGDHSHHAISASDPTVDDDEDDGFRVSDKWTNTTSGKTWILTDASAGAAVWTLISVTDHGDLAGLSDDDHTQYTKKATLTTKGSLYAASAASIPAEVAVGTDGSALIADSSKTAGVGYLKHNLAATAAPTTGDDSGDGYAVGSRWIDTTNDKEYVCVDASSGAAVWKETTGTGGGGSALTVENATGDVTDSAVTQIIFPDEMVDSISSHVVTIVLPTGAAAASIGDGSATSFAVDHSLGTTDIIVQLWDQSGSDPVEATADASSITATDNDTVTIVFGTAPSTDQYRVVVLKSGGGGGGGATDALLVQSGAGSKRIPGLTQHPDIPPVSADALDDEFDETDTGNPPTGWTAMGTLTGVDINSTMKSHLYLKAAANGSYNLAAIYKAWSPSAGDTVTVRLTDVSALGNYQKAGVFVGEATPGAVACSCISFEGSGDQHFSKRYSAPSGGGLTQNSGTAGFPCPVFLRIRYVSATSLDIQVSNGGRFFRTTRNFNPGFTVGSVGLFVSPENSSGDVEAVFDWIRFNWTA